MKLTKYGHACAVLEERGKKLVIDPGAFSDEFGDVNNVVAVVVTHEHADHCEPRNLEKIAAANPGVKMLAPADVVKQLEKLPVTAITGGDHVEVGPFKLQFFGERHAEIHPIFPRPQNIGVLVNDGAVYYPGDSFTLPEGPVKALLAPVSAPWLKIGETIEFVDAVKPSMCIPTHNALLSELGSSLTEMWLKSTCEKHNCVYKHLNPGDGLEV
jgi:L-ascorbate metabolism protein UlaG (beta-lactamase superfamily)